ncbi:MAG TPA: tetratricopeptide repeat protein [Candidatus Binataceae bacterium]|nr:tetratricopeptide repeat protein [Candidatus Binataceae bacterium]
MRIERNLLPGVAMRIIFVAFLFFIVSGCAHKTVDDYLHDGDQAMANGQVANAETDYQSAINAAPQDARPHLALGNLYAFEHKLGQAQPEYMKALELDPKNAAAHAGLGDAYADEQTSLAEAQYRAAVALDPAAVSYRLKLGALLQRRNKPREAEAQFLTAIGLEPKNAHAHLALGNLLSADTSRQDEAQAEYAQVKALDPSLMTAAPVVTAPPTVPTPATTGTVASTPPPKLRPLNRKFLLTHDSPVYQAPDSSAQVVAQVHHRKLVHVTGIAGGWLRIQLRSGIVGYIPATAAE